MRPYGYRDQYYRSPDPYEEPYQMRTYPRYQEPQVEYEDPGYYRREDADDFYFSRGGIADRRRAITPNNYRTGYAEGYPEYREQSSREDAILDPRRVPRAAFYQEEEYEDYPERRVYNRRRSEDLEYQTTRYTAPK